MTTGRSLSSDGGMKQVFDAGGLWFKAWNITMFPMSTAFIISLMLNLQLDYDNF